MVLFAMATSLHLGLFPFHPIDNEDEYDEIKDNYLLTKG